MFALTEKAVNEVRRVKEEQGLTDDDVLCVSVVGGGCSGFTYKMKFLTRGQVTDMFIDHEFYGLPVVVDKKSILYLAETTVDFYEGLDKRGFLFDNKAATGRCGCGSSFSM